MKVTGAALLSIGTAVPAVLVSKNAYVDFVTQLLALDKEKSAVVRYFVERSTIDSRYTMIQDFITPPDQWEFFGRTVPYAFPCTEKRNTWYKLHAPSLAVQAAQKALDEWGLPKEQITHVIFVSCTGLMAPGVEIFLIQHLGLQPTTQRFGINFMGCFGAFRALALAQALALQDDAYRILIVCTELCSLHIQPDLQVGTIIGNALFGDGAAAMIVGAHMRNGEKPLWTIERTASAVLPNSLDAMSWDVGNQGFVMRLLPEVPKHIGQAVYDFSRALLGSTISCADADWPVHPGGKAIIEAIEKSCGLAPDQTASAWQILKHFGNMSSATVPFVLDHLRTGPRRAWALGLGFGPGLSIEGILLKNVDA